MVPGAGFEPATFGLQNRCTTAVLTRPICADGRFLLGVVRLGNRGSDLLICLEEEAFER